MNRPLLFRASLALFGMLLLCATAYVGFGWVAWRHGDWLRPPLFKNQTPDNIRYYYKRVAIALFPGDWDGDGAMDGLELCWGTNFRVPEDHDLSIERLDHAEFDVHDANSHSTTYETTGNVPYEFLLPRINERLRVRGEVRCGGYREPLPSKFLIRITAPLHWQLALPGGQLQDSPLVVPITHEGRSGIVDFEVQPTEDASTVPESPVEITIDNAVTGMHIDTFKAKCLWPQGSPVVTVEELSIFHAPFTVADEGNARVYRLHWPPVVRSAPSTESILLEVAFGEDGSAWFPISFYPPTATECFIIHRRWNSDSPERDLKFRATPLRYSHSASRP